MIQSLDCPSCGGPLEYEGGNGATIRCPFCANSVILPEQLRATKADTMTRPAAPGNRRYVYLTFVIVAMTVGASAAFFAFRPSRHTPALPQQLSVPKPATLKPPRGETPKAPGYASAAFTFGGEGIGPGLLKDARSIALDGAGNVYVGEYSGGRIQVFDADGKFVAQWAADAKWPLRGMAADRKGRVYIVQRGAITRHDGMTGKKLDEMDYPAGWGFDDIAVMADGGLVASWSRNRDDIVRFDASGKTVQTIRSAISSQTESSELETRLAVDGLGNIYALGTFSNAVFRFSPGGKYVTRFGSAGDEPGQFRAPGSIAVDGQGRVYVGDFKGIQVFDGDGRYLGLIKVDGPASGMVFNDNNELFVVARNHVTKYVVNKP
ncbi:MAG TPA: NHL repeat-containing protein [Blastocatellia bacterium]|nr:NHL repeat-containing protein [Blastocatellia bacterium]